MAEYQEQSALFLNYFYLLLPFAIIISVNMVLNSYNASLFRTALITLWEGVLTRILFIALIFLYYFNFISLEQFIKLFVSIYLLQMLSMFIFILVKDKPSLLPNKELIKSVGINKMIGFGLLLTLTNISSLSMKHLDALMIGKYLNLQSVGIFSVAAYIALIIEIPLSSMERITHSKVAQAWANNDSESIQKMYDQSVYYLLMIGGFLLVGILCNLKELFTFLPNEYAQGTNVAMIACIGSYLNIATGINTSILFSSQKYLLGTFALLMLLLLTIGFNLWLIPLYGITGAALATCIASIIYNLAKYIIILYYFGMQPFNLKSLKILALTAMVFCVAYFIPSIINPIITIFIKSAAITVFYSLGVYLIHGHLRIWQWKEEK